MKYEQNLVRDPQAIENMANVDNICINKSGILTHN